MKSTTTQSSRFLLVSRGSEVGVADRERMTVLPFGSTLGSKGLATTFMTILAETPVKDIDEELDGYLTVPYNDTWKRVVIESK